MSDWRSVPYWQSEMTLEEAWELSPCGAAVFGNPDMRDVIWVKGQPTPYCWAVDGYVPVDWERLRNRAGWSPVEEDTFTPKMSKRHTPS